MKRFYCKVFSAAALIGLNFSAATAFEFTGSSWKQGQATFNVKFSESDPGLSAQDQAKFQSAFIDAANLWNSNSTFRYNINTSAAVDPCNQANGSTLNGVLFLDSSCGSDFGDATLAVARTFSFNDETVRTGIIFNTAFSWDVFSGSLFANPNEEFRRVAVHELGHSLGLGHESTASAIMQPRAGNLEVPQADDINGANSLYDNDNDAVGIFEDNCPSVANADQSNIDNDELGDACDANRDGDAAVDMISVDQQADLDNSSNSYFTFSGSSRYAQTFTSGFAGVIESVRVPINCTSGNLKISLTRTINGFPSSSSGDLLDSTTLASGASGSSANFATLNLGAYTTSAGEQLAIVAESSGSCRWSTTNSDGTYASGGAYLSNASSWFVFNGNSNMDFPFATVVTPTAPDNCPDLANDDQLDTNGNGIGNACESNEDTDNDTVNNAVDNCPAISNLDQANFDNDRFGDACDADIDNDGALNAIDSNDNNKNICSDIDNDQCNDCSSGGFDLSNDGADEDNDGICDLGDTDADNDTVDDNVDNCPAIANTNQANFDNDMFGDACDADIDNDGALNAVDSNDNNKNICSDNDNDQCNDCSSGGFNLNNDGADQDKDGLCDLGDVDDDNDTVNDNVDNCSVIANANQANFDNDAFGDACDVDDDNDTVNDNADNCQFTVNTNQADLDQDGEGDLCDNDADGDKVLSGIDSDDTNPFVCSDLDSDQCDDCNSGTFNITDDGLDTDGNDVCNIGDLDDDSDTVLDADDNCPLDANLDQADSDNNGVGDACEAQPLCIPVKTRSEGLALICL